MDNTESSLIPAAYDGREQALIKHRLLEDYLEKLFLIIGMGTRSEGSAELCYVDCFAGPWGDSSEDMKSTSIAISLNTLDTCRQKLASLRRFVKIKALYIEKNPASFQRLKGYLADHTPRGIRSHCFPGDFVALRQEILDWVGSDAFTFFFIDPKGYTPIAVPILAPLIRRPRSEFLINLMYDHANRAMSMQGMKSTMANVLGKDLDVTAMNPQQREHAFVHTYRESLKQCVPASNSRPSRAAHARIMNPERDRAKYHLVYLTSHPLGVVKFMEISEGTDRVQSRVRAEKRDKKKTVDTGMDSLFSAEEMADLDVTHATASEVDEFWRQYLGDGDRLIDAAAFADILERTDWFEGDLQASLVRLVKAGKVVNRSANAARRHKRPLHHERAGETLGWVAT
ncbi:three-Cys-motif partner protein TcmP [Roseateles sp.]|uniref:three-Cys-motif partner protein TcmP n=1 Tax=Roseateles sp. TaxID=1971397 RepID=UPI0035A06500